MRNKILVGRAVFLYHRKSIVSKDYDSEDSMNHLFSRTECQKNKRLFFNNSVHTSNPCGLPRLSLLCFHVTRISDTDTLIALTSVGAAVGSVGRKVEMMSNSPTISLSSIVLWEKCEVMNHSPTLSLSSIVLGSLRCSCLLSLFVNDML